MRLRSPPGLQLLASLLQFGGEEFFGENGEVYSRTSRLLGRVHPGGMIDNSPASAGLTGPKIMASAESAIHRQLKQADGLQPNPIAREPRALPWAGMSQAVGLKAAACMRHPQPGRWKMWVMTSVELR